MAHLGGPDPGAWDALALRSRNLFGTHGWADCWWRHFGANAVPHVLADDAGDPQVILPLYRSGRLLRQVRFVGNGPADQLGPVCAPEDLHRAAPLLRSALDDGSLAADVVLLQDMPVGEDWWAGLATTRVGTEPSPVLSFDGLASWEDFLATKSKNFRGQASRKPRRLEKAHQVTYRLATAATLPADLDDLFRLHAARWQGDSPMLEVRQRRFTEEFATVALEHGWLRLWLLDVDDEAVAALLGFRFADDEYYYQLGRDPGWDEESVGFVLLVHVVRDALESGMTEFRFLRGDEDYKHRFANRAGDIETRAVPNGLRGRVAIEAAARRRRRGAA